MTAWMLRSGPITRIVHAADQFEAFDTLREMPLGYFALLVTAEQQEDMNPFGIRTSALMFRWHRDADARLCIEAAMREGLPDTTEADLAGRSDVA